MRTVGIKGKAFEVEDEPADFWGWVSKGNYNPEWDALDRFLRPEHTFVDLGAWIGSHSLYASTLAKQVMAVEPDPVAFSILQKNIAGRSISAYRVAITGHEGVVTLGSELLGASTTRANKNEGGPIGAWEPGQQFDISCTTLRKFAQETGLPRSPGTLFIKIDIEGCEEQILQDVEFFREHEPTVYLELHPFWWKNEHAGWNSVRAVADAYKRVLNLRMLPVSLSSEQPRSLLLAMD